MKLRNTLRGHCHGRSVSFCFLLSPDKRAWVWRDFLGCGRPGTEGRAAACLQSQRSRSLLVLSTLVPFPHWHAPKYESIPLPHGLYQHALVPFCATTRRHSLLVSSSKGCQSCSVLHWPGPRCYCRPWFLLLPSGNLSCEHDVLVCIQTVIPWASEALNVESLCVLLAWHLAPETLEAHTFSS